MRHTVPAWVDRAQQLLREGDLPTSQIALEAGFFGPVASDPCLRPSRGNNACRMAA
jgi:transcriptional regulator GlxA family with amidase domain